MSWNLAQVTLSGAGANQLIPPTGTANVFCRQIIIQNNAAHSMRVGDSTVSSTKGIYLAAGPGGGSFNSGVVNIYNTYLGDLYVAGTNGDLVDVFYNM